MFRSAFTVFALLLGAAHFVAAGQEEKATPKELIQYILDAQKAGIKAPQIRLNAVKAGWPESVVNSALDSVRNSPPPPDNAPAGAAKPAPAVPQPSDPNAGKSPAFETIAGTHPEKMSAPAAATPPAGAPPTPAALGTPAGGDPASIKAKAAEGSLNGDYVIGEGDVIQVVVWGEPNASVQSATVRPDGKITMPLIKEVLVAGLTPAQVESAAQEQLSKLIQTADVTVIVVQINSKKIFLTGAVRKEGPLKYTYKMTVLQAISEAGGLTDYAKKKNIYVLHTENGRQYRFPFNYISVLRGENMEQNIMLSPGDTIVVP